MVEVLFSESETASMKMAKSILVSDCGTVNTHPQFADGMSEKVICLGFILDIGDIKEPVAYL